MILENGTKLVQHQVAEVASTITRELVEDDGRTMRVVRNVIIFRHHNSSTSLGRLPLAGWPVAHTNVILLIIIMDGYLIEERRRWPVITASPRGGQDNVLNKFRIWKARSDEETVPVTWSDEKLILLY